MDMDRALNQEQELQPPPPPPANSEREAFTHDSKCAPLQYNTSPGVGMSSNKQGDNGRTMTSSQLVSPSHANLPLFLGLQLQPQGALLVPSLCNMHPPST